MSATIPYSPEPVAVNVSFANTADGETGINSNLAPITDQSLILVAYNPNTIYNGVVPASDGNYNASGNAFSFTVPVGYYLAADSTFVPVITLA